MPQAFALTHRGAPTACRDQDQASPWVQYGPHLQRGTGSVVHIGQDLHGLLEHNTEGAGRTVAAEACVVLAKDRVAVRMDDLGTEATELPGAELGKQELQGLMGVWPGHVGTGSRRRVCWGHSESLMGHTWEQTVWGCA